MCCALPWRARKKCIFKRLNIAIGSKYKYRKFIRFISNEVSGSTITGDSFSIFSDRFYNNIIHYIICLYILYKFFSAINDINHNNLWKYNIELGKLGLLRYNGLGYLMQLLVSQPFLTVEIFFVINLTGIINTKYIGIQECTERTSFQCLHHPFIIIQKPPQINYFC